MKAEEILIIKTQTDLYNETGDETCLDAIWHPAEALAKIILFKRKPKQMKEDEVEELAMECVIRLIQRIKTRYNSSNPYTIENPMSVIYFETTYQLYNKRKKFQDKIIYSAYPTLAATRYEATL